MWDTREGCSERVKYAGVIEVGGRETDRKMSCLENDCERNRRRESSPR